MSVSFRDPNPVSSVKFRDGRNYTMGVRSEHMKDPAVRCGLIHYMLCSRGC